MTALKISAAGVDDLDFIYANEKRSWLRYYVNQERGITAELLSTALDGLDGSRRRERLDQWREDIETSNPNQAFFIARRGGDPVGSITPFIGSDQRHRLGSFHVEPAFHRQGIGSALFARSLKWNAGHDIWVHVITYNQPAIDYYQRRDFKIAEHSQVTEPRLPDGIEMPILKMVRRQDP